MPTFSGKRYPGRKVSPIVILAPITVVAAGRGALAVIPRALFSNIVVYVPVIFYKRIRPLEFPSEPHSVQSFFLSLLASGALLTAAFSATLVSARFVSAMVGLRAFA